MTSNVLSFTTTVEMTVVGENEMSYTVRIEGISADEVIVPQVEDVIAKIADAVAQIIEQEWPKAREA